MGNVNSKTGIAVVSRKWVIYICILTFLMAVYGMFLYLFYSRNQVDIRNLRIQYANAVMYAESGKYEKLNAYECIVVGVNSKIIYTNSNLYKIGESVNLHAFSTGNSTNGNVIANQFMSPLIGKNGQIGTLIILLPYTHQNWSIKTWIEFLVPIVFLIAIFLCSIRLYHYISIDVVKTLSSIKSMLVEILKGNYHSCIDYKEKNELEELCEKIIFLRDELENNSIQSKKLLENERMLLASISHDLKTPIATIIGCAEGIRDGVVQKPADIRRYVKIILNKSELLIKLINDILVQTHTEVNKSFSPKEVYSRKFILDVLGELSSDVNESGLELKVDDIPNILLNIEPDHIFQVFQNIIGNSIKYTPKGGYIHIGFEQCENALAVEITDNGQGIAANDIPFVFDRFYRGEKARTQREIGGSGLGLSIVRNIIEQHGGKVECDSMLGHGATIRFLLPIS